MVINVGGQHETTFIDSRTQAESLTPLKGALPPGTYTLRFELKGYKVLGDGKVEKPIVVKAAGFSKSAEKKITAAGGEIVRL